MPRARAGPRLWLKPAVEKDGRTIRRATWVIRDGSRMRGTGCGEADREQAEIALADYIIEQYQPPRSRNRDPAHILVADVLNIYLADIVPHQARPGEAADRIVRLSDFFGGKTLADINGALCRAYAQARGSPAAARRELEDLRAAINHHRREGLCAEIVSVALPGKPAGRQRWLTRAEAARLIWAAWRYRERQKGHATGRRSRRHVAKFILVALYTGTRAGAVCAAAFEPLPGAGWIDLERGVFYRRPQDARETKKRRPPVPLPNRLLAHLRRWRAAGQTYAVEWNGRPVQSVRKAFARAARDAGLGDDVTPHVLRHTAATWQMQAGVPIWEAAGYLGMTEQTLRETYGHHHPDYMRAARDAFTAGNRNGNRNSGTMRDDPHRSETNLIDLQRKIATKDL